MWILQATVEGAPEPRTFVLPAGTFIVGRKDEPTTQILILNDKAISREHARIVIDPLPDAADSSAKAHATFIDSSRFGSSVNGMAVKAESEVLVHDSLIDFSKHSKSSQAKFRFTWEPVVLCLPLPSPAVAAAAAQLTIPCKSQWTEACTHLVVPGRTASLSGATACAAAEGKPIITADWVYACLARPAVRTPLPDCTGFAAPIEQPLLPGGGRVAVPVVASRSSEHSSCLAASTCIWSVSCQDRDLEAAVKLAGGRVVSAELVKGAEAKREGAFLLLGGREGELSELPARLRKLPWTRPDLLAAVIISGGAITLQAALHPPAAATTPARTSLHTKAATPSATPASITRSQGAAVSRGSSGATDLTTGAGEAQGTPQSVRGRGRKVHLPLSTSERPATSPQRRGYGQKLCAAAHDDGGDGAGSPAAQEDAGGVVGKKGNPKQGTPNGEFRGEGPVAVMDRGGIESKAQGGTPKGRKRKKAAVEHTPKKGGKGSASKAKKSRRGGDGRSPARNSPERVSTGIRSPALQPDARNAGNDARVSAAKPSEALTPAGPTAVSDKHIAQLTAWRASVTPGWVRRRHHDTQEEAHGQHTQAVPSAAAHSAISQAAAAAAPVDPDLDRDNVGQGLPAGGFNVTGALEEGGEGPVGEDVELGAGNCTVEESLIVKLHAPLADPAPTPPEYEGVPNYKAFRKQQPGFPGKRNFVTFDIKPYCERTARSGQDIEDEQREVRRLQAAEGLFAAKNLKPRKAVPGKKGSRA